MVFVIIKSTELVREGTATRQQEVKGLPVYVQVFGTGQYNYMGDTPKLIQLGKGNHNVLVYGAAKGYQNINRAISGDTDNPKKITFQYDNIQKTGNVIPFTLSAYAQQTNTPSKSPSVSTQPVKGNKLADVRIQYSQVGDEVVTSVSITNLTQTTNEYRAFMYNSTGALINKEPDFYWKNIKPGQTANIKLSTKWKYQDVNTLLAGYRVAVMTQTGVIVSNTIINTQTGTTAPAPINEDTRTNQINAPPITTDTGTTGGNQAGSPLNPQAPLSEKLDGVKDTFQNAGLIAAGLLAIALLLDRRK